MIGGHNHRYHYPNGQTLLELIVVLGIFIMLVSSVSGIFISIINAERRALAIQEVLNNTRYTIEIMARAIRQADPDEISTDTTTPGRPCYNETQNKCLSFDHPMKRLMVYKLDSTNKTIDEINYVCSNDSTKWCAENSDCGVGTCDAQSDKAITPSDVKVERLNFSVIGTELNYDQPRVTISLRIGASPNANPAMDIQTTVSLRTMQE